MSEKLIPIAYHRQLNAVPTIPTALESPTGFVADALARPLQELRISLTDRCNFRCVYCMPEESFGKDRVFLPQTSLLSFEEITRIAQIFVAHGVQKIRLTGGEPLLRKRRGQISVRFRGYRAAASESHHRRDARHGKNFSSG